MTHHQGGKPGNSVLVVATPQAASLLLEQCARHGWNGSSAGSCAESDAALRSVRPAMVFTQDALPDGTWREVFQSAAAIQPEAARIVCSSQSTLQLWMDVLAQGGRELLPEPCPDELLAHVLDRYDGMKVDKCALA